MDLIDYLDLIDLLGFDNRKKAAEEEEGQDEVKMHFRTRMAKNIYKHLFQTKLAERNELFLPGRMAYVVDLEEEFAESDIPCTSIRSKADCPTLEVNISTAGMYILYTAIYSRRSNFAYHKFKIIIFLNARHV